MESMTELQRILVGNSVGAPATNILEALDEGLVHRELAGSPHSIYEEVWHLAFWQELSLRWIGGDAAPYPQHASDGFPALRLESWDTLRARFLGGTRHAAEIAGDSRKLEASVICTSPLPREPRLMLVRDLLSGIAAHNAYHLGRVVLLRQIFGCWPPPSGGDTW
jgi:hypothetical protein